MLEDTTVMLLTCDKNEDLWEPFFVLLNRYWPEYSGDIFVNTESKEIKNKNYNLVYSKEKFESTTPWSYRLYKCLKQINTDYVLLIMDDFFLTDYTDDEEIHKCIQRMKKNEDIASFIFSTSKGKVVENEYGRYGLKSRFAPFRMNLQVGLWRRKTLLKFIRKHEGPWQFETWGSKRIIRYPDKIYHMNYNAKKVFTYQVGGVIADGRWRTDEALQLFKRENLEIDTSKRLVYYPGDKRKTEIVRRNFFVKCFQVIKSLI